MLFGEFLLKERVINQYQLQRGIAYRKKSGKRFGEILVEFGFINRETLVKYLEIYAKKYSDKKVEIEAMN